jgi:hypothetical protein
MLNACLVQSQASFVRPHAVVAVAVAGAVFAGAPVQLWPGDELSWSCTFNTSTTNRTVLGMYLTLHVLAYHTAPA